MDEKTLQLVIDSVFAVIEAKEGPLARAITEAIRKSIDANLGAILALVQTKAGGA